ncbi:unnamed protein product [Mytilus edulis]|uniref:Uncharacterized protein n=1 Tax=Mytilus edulis TaxID=6550 RepID=A0A8S3UGL3_MYTED|nr:unnamed protein product [Mytilus edulis]
MEAGNVVEYSENIFLMSKLPFHMYDRWRNVVYRLNESHITVKFIDFVNFVKSEAKKATDPTYGNIAMNYSNSRNTNQRQHGQRVSNFCDTAKNTSNEIHCAYCNGTHELGDCKRLIARPREDRITYLKGSSITFCSDKLMRQLGANGKKTQITINTMGNTQTLNTYAINGLQVSSLSMEHMVDLPEVYTKADMTVSKEHIPHRKQLRNGLI